MTKKEKIIYDIAQLDNDDLRKILKEVSPYNINNELSQKADKLFKLYSDEGWMLGIDRFNFIRRCLEQEIIKRVENNLF